MSGPTASASAVGQPDIDPKLKAYSDQIWPYETYEMAFKKRMGPNYVDPLAKYKREPGLLELGLDPRGLKVAMTIYSDVTSGKDLAAMAVASNKLFYLRKAAKGGCKPNDVIYNGMVTALEKDDPGEYCRIANLLNAMDLILSAAMNGMDEKDRDTLVNLYEKELLPSKTASQQQPIMRKMQDLMDKLLDKSFSTTKPS